MNKWMATGRLTRDPEVRYGGSKNSLIARFTLAVDRRFKRDNQPTADFFNCVAFGKTGEFIEKYMKKGTKIAVVGSIQNDNYEDKNGVKHYGTSVVIEEVEFAESKGSASKESKSDEYMNVDNTIDDDEIPFS